MLAVPSTFIEGKKAFYGEIRKEFERLGFVINGNWEYHKAFFDNILAQYEGVTIYLRVPIYVLQGQLDRDDAFFEFGQPFLLKHVMHIGNDPSSDFSVMEVVGLSQFQPPLDPDDKIENEEKWRSAGRSAVDRLSSLFN